MMERSDQQPEFYFDIQCGSFLLGKAAVEAHINAGGNPADISPLADLLLQSDPLIDSTAYPKLETNRHAKWTSQQKINHGKLLNKIVSREYPNQRVTATVVENMYRLGLAIGSERKIINCEEFPTFGRFLAAVGVEGSHQRGLYNYWTFDDSIEYVQEEAERIVRRGEKPAKKLFEDTAHKGEGPSPVTLKKLTKLPIAKLLDLIGFPYTPSWEDNHFMDWGVNLMLANNGTMPSSRDIYQLSLQGRGPGVAAIYVHYGVEKFHTLIKERYPARVAQILEEVEQIPKDDLYPRIAKYRTGTIASNIRIIHIASRHKILDSLHVQLSQEDKDMLVLFNKPKLFINHINRKHTKSPDIIKNLVRGAPEFRKAWPLNDFMTNLAIERYQT